MTTLPVISMEDRFDDGGLFLFIALQGCNLKCRHCYVYEQVTGPAKEKTIIELQRLANSGIYDGVIVSGGEPLLYTERLREFLRGVEGEVTVYTNAVRINALTRLIENGRLVDNLLISIKHPDDIDEIRDDIDYSWEFLDNLMAFERAFLDDVDINFTIVDTENVTEDFMEFAESCFDSDVTIRHEDKIGDNKG